MVILFLDTNVIIRHVTQDHPEHSEQARQLFRRVEKGELIVETCEGVVVEAVQVLSSPRLYGVSRSVIRGLLAHLLSLHGIRIPHKRSYLRALDLYASSNLDFVDCLEVAHMERLQISSIASFDRDFETVDGITRVTPGES